VPLVLPIHPVPLMRPPPRWRTAINSMSATWVALSAVSIGFAGRVVPVMHLITFWRLQTAPLTTTMEHRGGQDNDDGASSWFRRLGTGPAPVRGLGIEEARAASEAGAASEASGQ